MLFPSISTPSSRLRHISVHYELGRTCMRNPASSVSPASPWVMWRQGEVKKLLLGLRVYPHPRQSSAQWVDPPALYLAARTSCCHGFSLACVWFLTYKLFFNRRTGEKCVILAASSSWKDSQGLFTGDKIQVPRMGWDQYVVFCRLPAESRGD